MRHTRVAVLQQALVARGAFYLPKIGPIGCNYPAGRIKCDLD
jgi:hypothetical protein